MLEDQRFLAAETPCPPGQVKCNKDSKEVQAANEFAKKQGQAKVREMIVDMILQLKAEAGQGSAGGTPAGNGSPAAAAASTGASNAAPTEVPFCRCLFAGALLLMRLS
jgi:hypothetical protein